LVSDTAWRDGSVGNVGLRGAVWLTSIVFCAVGSVRPLLIAAARSSPVGIVNGIGIWFGEW
jgi:hypothetical protein